MAPQKHAADCNKTSTECPHCQSSDLSNGSLSAHLENDCPRIEISCPHWHFGCPAKATREAILETHLPTSCLYEPLKPFFLANNQRIRQLEAENRELSDRVISLRADCSALETRMSRVQQRIGPASGEAVTDSLEDSVAALTAQVAELSRSNSEARRAADRTHHDMRGEVTSMQMGLHELRGEMMAFQQAQHYEHASRLYSRTSSDSSTVAAAAAGKEGKAISSTSTSAGEAPLAMLPSAQQMYTPFGGPGYPFPPYMGAQPFYGPMPPPNLMMQPPPPGRRFYGWPYAMYGGGTSPDGGAGGGTKL